MPKGDHCLVRATQKPFFKKIIIINLKSQQEKCVRTKPVRPDSRSVAISTRLLWILHDPEIGSKSQEQERDAARAVLVASTASRKRSILVSPKWLYFRFCVV